MTNEKTANIPSITISIVEHDRLVANDKFLSCLLNAGVDNWDGYDFAVEDFRDGN